MEAAYRRFRKDSLCALIPKEYILGPTVEEELDDVTFGEDTDLIGSFSRTPEELAKAEALAGDVLPKVVGTSTFHERTREVLTEFSDLFSRTVGVKAAFITPMEFELQPLQWEKLKGQLSGPPRRQSALKSAEIRRQLDLMLKLGVIQHSQSSTYSQVLLAKKPNNKFRFCADYRVLNLCIEAMGWPLPNISNMIQRIGAHKPQFFGVVDTTSGYHQVDLAARCRALAAFITEFGVFEPVRISFGIKTAPSYFQQQIAGIIMSGLNYVILEMYIDDILLYAQSEEEYLDNLRTLFSRLLLHNITLNPDKCRFCLTEVEFVGHLISRDGIRFSPEKLRKVFEFELPQSVRQLRSFLGLANYFHDHVEGYAEVAGPLYNLISDTKKANRLYWSCSSLTRTMVLCMLRRMRLTTRLVACATNLSR